MTNTEQNDVTVTGTAGTNDAAADKPQAPTWRDALPWEGKPSRGDKVLLGSMFAITGFYLAMLPVKPFLIANHPILLEFVTGSKAAVGAGAAFARIGQAPLWLVIVAGVVGAAKFDWLFWLMGRRWGGRVVRMFAPNDRARARIDKAEQLPRWVGPLAVCLAVLPGIPAAMAYAFAGWQKLRLGWFIALNVLSTAVIVGVVAGLGYSAGQAAVDLVLLVDKYALWVSLALIVGAAFWSSWKQARKQKANGADRSE
ncbi:DedA family protein [Enemella dayhoffiae]|uniref:DedA family protein n=1 Tax=Enemella dayhoffiae TaxID=2016507 RepID=A0A255H2S0_9ACTN|nr:DedA family protein [Enemella dayhoffiae]OYO20964.1 DedA family protein [Enemella dayhoffiae]